MGNVFVKASGGPGHGIFPDEIKARMVNRRGSAFAKGDACMVDLGAASTEITTNDSDSYKLLGDTSNVWRTIIAVDAQAVNFGIIGVVTEVGGIADNAEGEVAFYGVLPEAKVSDTVASANIQPGDALVAASAKVYLDANVLSTERIVGIYVDAQTTAVSARLKRVFFNGFTGWGTGLVQ